MKSKKVLAVIAFAALVLVTGVTTVVAAPLADGTKLSVIQGVGSVVNNPCPGGGSCFSMEASPGTETWTDFGPGTDGGFILGKDQVSGGQDLVGGGSVTTPGELSSFWSYFSNNGTFTTNSFPGQGLLVGASDNLFDDAGCTLAGCIGKTELNAWYVAWNAGVYPMGSGYPCDPVVTDSCTVDQVNGISIDYYTIDPVEGGDWSIYHRWVVPFGNFANVKFGVIIRGKVSVGCVACNDNDACTDDECDPVTFACTNTPVSCDDNNICTDDAVCDPDIGCTYTNNTLPCEDYSVCTTGDVCSDGVCSGTGNICIDPPILILPEADTSGLGNNVEFRWKMVPGATKYQFHNCLNDPTASCNPETVTAQRNSKGIFYAGGGGLLLIGMTFIGGLKGRKMMVLLFVLAVVFAGGTLISCSTGSDDVQPPPPAADEVQHFASGLSPNATYYWKVVADDGSGGTASSEVRSFTTQ